MVPILIAKLKTKLFNFIQTVKTNFNVIAVTIIMILAAFLFILHNKLKHVELQLVYTLGNYEYYMNKCSNEEQKNKVLHLTLNEYKETNDSIIDKIKTIQKELKLKENHLKQVQTLESKIVHDTTIVVKSNDFKMEIKPNTLTSIVINKTDSMLTHELSILNVQTLYVTNKRIYKNKYKNWFSRLLHFDFKKKDNIEYQIHNSNDLIEITDSRMIEIK